MKYGAFYKARAKLEAAGNCKIVEYITISMRMNDHSQKPPSKAAEASHT